MRGQLALKSNAFIGPEKINTQWKLPILLSRITDPAASLSRRVHIDECLSSCSRSSVKSNPWELFSVVRNDNPKTGWERGGGRDSSQSDHAREVTRVNRTRNNHDFAWKKKIKGKSHASALGIVYRVFPKPERGSPTLWGALPTRRGDEKRKSRDRDKFEKDSFASRIANILAHSGISQEIGLLVSIRQKFVAINLYVGIKDA